MVAQWNEGKTCCYGGKESVFDCIKDKPKSAEPRKGKLARLSDAGRFDKSAEGVNLLQLDSLHHQ